MVPCPGGISEGLCVYLSCAYKYFIAITAVETFSITQRNTIYE